MKKMILVIALVFTGGMTQAQDYFHGLGGQYNYAIFSSPGYTAAASIPGFVYKATLGFENRRGPSFGVSAYPFLGLTLNTAAGSSIGAELPLVAEIHFGDFDDKDFFLGVGFSASFSAADSYFSSAGGSIFGPQLSLGGQFEVRDQIYGVRAAYTYGANRGKTIDEFGVESKTNKTLISLGVYYLLGQ